MTLIIPPGFGNAALIFTSDTGTPPLVTTIGVDLGAFGGDFVAAANKVHTTFGASVCPQLWNGVSLERVSLLVGSDGGDGSVESTEAPVSGGRTLSTPPPLAQAAIIRKGTNGLGRRNRGRMFLPASTAESEVDASGEITTARQNALNSNLNSWRTTMESTSGGGALPLVLFHTLPPTDPTPIVALTTAPLVGWVRGRIR